MTSVWTRVRRWFSDQRRLRAELARLEMLHATRISKLCAERDGLAEQTVALGDQVGLLQAALGEAQEAAKLIYSDLLAERTSGELTAAQLGRRHQQLWGIHDLASGESTPEVLAEIRRLSDPAEYMGVSGG